ncbi:MAG: Spx/MgsR family RNA polymerase-binding regulatory protein [Robiginitomaculum sp.]|nr:Spx/MgsR family RNA polymerase-binding regulatory protein [Robiginitomaculum sp.]
MKFYGLKTCDTCRKAQKVLRMAGVEFDVIDVRTNGIDADKLLEWVNTTDWKILLNTRSTTWRNLNSRDKDNVDQSKAIALMATHPTLIKRPVIERSDKITVGWSKDVIAQYLN